MGEPLKNIYNDAFFDELSSAILAAVPGFKKKPFLIDCRSNGWQEMELKQRMRHLAAMLDKHLQGDYKKKLAKVLQIINALPAKSSNQYGSLAYMLFPDFVEQFGLAEPDLSLDAMEKITSITSCEFAIRPYLIKYPGKVMARMLTWSKDPDEKLRRFSSEGCRPRLPWAMAIPALKKSPVPIFPILDNLKNDPSEFVRRSVANNLNDIAKDHPDLVLKIAKKWQGISAATDKLVKHACRSLLKRGHEEALQLFGTGAGVQCIIKNLLLKPGKIQVGETLHFSFHLLLNENKPRKLRVEFAIGFMKANGKTSRKIFKIAESIFQNKKETLVNRKLSFKDLTTRKHYAGSHSITIIVNGKEYAKKEFSVIG